MNADEDGIGSKWSFNALCMRLANEGYDVNYIMKNIEDVILKTLISAESDLVSSYRRCTRHRNQCFEVN